MKVLWSDRAIADLIAIGRFIARDNPQGARRHVQDLIQVSKRLSKFPGSGRMIPELQIQDKNLREMVYGRYRIVYQIRPLRRRLTILTIFEAHRTLPNGIR